MISFEVKTKGHYDFINITDKVVVAVDGSGVKNGVAVVFIPASTCGLVIMEYEEGLIKDLINVFEKIAPEKTDYFHHQKWGDENGAAHIKSVLLGTDLVIPVENGELQLGTWQQIVLIDFDERPRTREIIIKVIQGT